MSKIHLSFSKNHDEVVYSPSKEQFFSFEKDIFPIWQEHKSNDIQVYYRSRSGSQAKANIYNSDFIKFSTYDVDSFIKRGKQTFYQFKREARLGKASPNNLIESPTIYGFCPISNGQVQTQYSPIILTFHDNSEFGNDHYKVIALPITELNSAMTNIYAWLKKQGWEKELKVELLTGEIKLHFISYKDFWDTTLVPEKLVYLCNFDKLSYEHKDILAKKREEKSLTSFMECLTNCYQIEEQESKFTYYYINNFGFFEKSKIGEWLPENPTSDDIYFRACQFPSGWHTDGKGLLWKRKVNDIHLVKVRYRQEKYNHVSLDSLVEYEEIRSMFTGIFTDLADEEKRDKIHKYFDKFLSKKERRDYVAAKAQENTYEGEQLIKSVKENPLMQISLQDSIDSGNCPIGSKEFIQQYNLSENVYFSELLQHKDLEEMLKNQMFVKVLVLKLVEKQELAVV